MKKTSEAHSKYWLSRQGVATAKRSNRLAPLPEKQIGLLQ
jgi:hypothetical protein